MTPGEGFGEDGDDTSENGFTVGPGSFVLAFSSIPKPFPCFPWLLVSVWQGDALNHVTP